MLYSMCHEKPAKTKDLDQLHSNQAKEMSILGYYSGPFVYYSLKVPFCVDINNDNKYCLRGTLTVFVRQKQKAH